MATIYVFDTPLNKAQCYPHIFTYDKTSGKLSYDSIKESYSYITFDENGNIAETSSINEDFTGDKKMFETVNRIVKNALVVEKEFGCPQDIEGGIKGDDIYFWQTRNIVNEK